MYYPYFNDEVRRKPHWYPYQNSILRLWREEWLQKAMRASANPIDRMLWIDNLTYLPGDLLVKMDIASMHCGLETRSPLLDHKVIEFCAALPIHLKVSEGTGKHLLKKLALRYLPQELVYRKKMGFGIPLSEWLKGPLEPVTREILFNASLMEPLNPSKIREIASEFYNKGVDHSSRIWLLLMFGMWKKVCSQDD
jgi:asparagine synthase (glutamine-hydrolysing)